MENTFKNYYQQIHGDASHFNKIDGIDSKYTINKNGILYNNDTKTFVNYVALNDRISYDVKDLSGRRLRLSAHRLVLMAFCPLDITIVEYLKLPMIVFDKNYSNIELSNLSWKIPEGGIESKTYKGYYSIPWHIGYFINKEYEVIIPSKKEICKVTTPDGARDYPKITRLPELYSSFKNCWHTRQFHRLICLTFLPIPDFNERILVNHKDGNKLNYNLSNLEWSTYSENRQYAIANDLCVQSVKVRALDTRNNKKYLFNSLQEAARITKRHAWDIKKAIDAYSSSKQIRLHPWIFTSYEEELPRSYKRLENKKTGFTYFKVVKDGEVKYIRGVRSLSRYVKSDMILPLTNSDNFCFRGFNVSRVCIEDIPQDIVNSFKEAYANVGGSKPMAIKVTDLNTNQISTFDNTLEFALKIGANKKTIQKSMSMNQGRWSNYLIEYRSPY